MPQFLWATRLGGLHSCTYVKYTFIDKLMAIKHMGRELTMGQTNSCFSLTIMCDEVSGNERGTGEEMKLTVDKYFYEDCFCYRIFSFEN